MNKIIMIVGLLLPLAAFSKTDSIPKNSQGVYEYSEVINVDSSTAENLYSRSKMFVTTTFKSGKAVTQLNDDNTRTVVGHGAMDVKIKMSMGSTYSNVTYTFTLQCKDNRYRYSITDFVLEAGTESLDDEKYWNKNRSTKRILKQVEEQVNTNINSLIIELKKNMAAKTALTSDW